MPWTPKPAELEALASAPPERRLPYFVSHVCDQRRLWGLQQGTTWARLHGTDAVALWPHPLYAEAMAFGDWAGFRPGLILLEELREEWFPALIENDQLLAVFPVAHHETVLVRPEELRELLVSYLHEHYGYED